MKKIGFIGLGVMGNPMARNLLKKGYPVTVYDSEKKKMQALEKSGAKAASSSKETATGADVVITMLPSSPHVEEAVLGKDGILEGIHEGTVYLDMSTIDPITTRKIAKILSEKNIEMIDSPVSKGEQAAIDGTLTLFIGGGEDTLETVRDVLEAMGANLFHMGKNGSGSTTKLVNNLCSGIICAAYAETFVFGTKAGVEPDKLLDAMMGGSAASEVLKRHIRDCALKRNFDEVTFPVDYIMKDFELAMITARELRIPLMLASFTHEIYAMLRAKGLGKGFYPEVIRVFEDYAGVEVKI